MNLKRAVMFGAFIWVMIFFEVSILMFGFKMTGTTYYTWHYIFSAVIVVFASWIYFKKVKGGLENGIIAGIIFIMVGCILDAIITIPLFVKNYGFFLDRYLWIGLIEGIVATSLVGALKKRQEDNSS